MITPWECFDRPHMACIQNDIPILGVKENTTCLNEELSDHMAYWVDNYVEAVGWLQSRKEGIEPRYVSDDYADEVDPHICCFSYPNCDVDPLGCVVVMGIDEVEKYGHR